MNLNSPSIEIDFGTFAEIPINKMKRIMINGEDLSNSIIYLSNKQIKVKPSKIDKYLEIDMAYSANFQSFVDTTKITLVIY